MKIIQEQAPGVTSESMMLALYPPKSWRDALKPLMDEDLADFTHLTVLYIGQVNEYLVPHLKQALAKMRFPEQRLTLSGQAIFNAGKSPVSVLLVNGPDLPRMRASLEDLIDQTILSRPKEYGFVPHITLSYKPNMSTKLSSWLQRLDLPPWEPEHLALVRNDAILMTLPIGGES